MNWKTTLAGQQDLEFGGADCEFWELTTPMSPLGDGPE